MLEGEVSLLALDAGAVDGHRALCRAEHRHHLSNGHVVELDPAHLGQDRCLPRDVGEASLQAPRNTRSGMELPVAPVGKRAVAADAPAADALEEPGEQIDPAPVPRSTAPGLRGTDVRDAGPQFIGYGRIRSPRGRKALLVGTAVPAHPAVEDRIAQHLLDPLALEPRRCGQLRDADIAEGVALEQTDGRPDARWIDLEGVWRLGGAAEAKRGVTALICMAFEFRRIAIGDPLGEAPAIPLRPGRFGHEFVPGVRIRRQDLAIAHRQGNPSWMEVVLEELDGPAEIPLPAVGVSGEEELERACLGRLKHRHHRR